MTRYAGKFHAENRNLGSLGGLPTRAGVPQDGILRRKVAGQSKKSWLPVGKLLRPILWSSRLMVTPAAPYSTTKPVRPAWLPETSTPKLEAGLIAQ
jgi:hypothetical protein